MCIISLQLKYQIKINLDVNVRLKKISFLQIKYNLNETYNNKFKSDKNFYLCIRFSEIYVDIFNSRIKIN